MDALHVLEQADDLCHWLGQDVVDPLRDCRDLGAYLGTNVPFDEIVDLIEPHERSERPLREVHGGVDEELLCKLDDRAVRATNVLGRTSLRAEARDDLNDEVDLVGQERVQVDEAVARQFGQLDVGREPRVLGQAASMLIVERAKRRLSGRILRKDAAAGDLGDVGGLEMDLQRESVHQPGELDLFVVEAADELR